MVGEESFEGVLELQTGKQILKSHTRFELSDHSGQAVYASKFRDLGVALLHIHFFFLPA